MAIRPQHIAPKRKNWISCSVSCGGADRAAVLKSQMAFAKTHIRAIGSPVLNPHQVKQHFDLFKHYTHNGTHSSGNSWGAKRFIGEPADEAHKYRALRDCVIETGQYDPRTGTVKRISEKAAAPR